MSSPEHRAWLLDPRVKAVGVAISKSRHGTYATWAFSSKTPEATAKERHQEEIFNKFEDFISWKPLNILLQCIASFGIALGVYGLCVHYQVFTIPRELWGIIGWMTIKGIQGLFWPITFIVCGVLMLIRVRESMY